MTDGERLMASRRAVLIAAAVGSAALAMPARSAGAAEDGSAPAAGATATGQVFETVGADRKGIAGVLVSNGREVAVTDAEGRYSLPVADESIVFVVKPSGFMTPVDSRTQLPRFYRIHQPAGTPAPLDLTFPGIAPTGPLPASIDFPLVRQEEPKAFEVVLFTDPQPESDVEVDFIREDVVDALTGTPAKFGITCGDLMFDDLSLYGRLNGIVGTIGIPWYTVGGNHDLNLDAPGRQYSRETYKSVFGPTDYAFAYADAVFVMLDDVEYLGPEAKTPSGAKYQGRLTADQLTFVGNVLAHVPEDKLVVVVLHIPLQNYLDDKGADVNLTNRADLFKLFTGRRYTVSFSGHTHTTEHHYFGEAEGWPSPVPHHHHVLTAVSGSWWSGPFDHRGVAVADSRDGTPNGFHMLAIDGNRYTTRFVPAKEPNGRQMRLSIGSHFKGEVKEVMRDFRPGQLLTPPIMRAALPEAHLVVNVFDGGPKTKVTMTVSGGDPIELMPRARPDPFVNEVFTRNQAVKKPWIKAEVSSHIWVAPLPSQLPAGTHRVVVTAITEYGGTTKATMALEIV